MKRACGGTTPPFEWKVVASHKRDGQQQLNQSIYIMSVQDDIERIISEFQGLARKKNGNSLPTPQQLYAIGGVLFRIQQQQQQQQMDKDDLIASFRELVNSMSERYLNQVLTLFHRGLETLRIESKSVDDLSDAVRTLGGLFSQSPRMCQIAYSKNWVSTLASIYDIFILKESSRAQKDELLSLLSFLILDGLFERHSEGSMEEVVMAAIQAMEEESTDCLRDLQEWQRHSEPSQRSLENSIKNLPFDDDTMHQREYIFNMLESSRLKESTEHSGIDDAARKPAAKAVRLKPVEAADELERRIAQVKQVIPDLGEGFVETALSLFQGNVETTVATLLNDPSQYPPSLQFLDRSLPRRRKARAADEAKESAEAKQVVKEMMAREEQREQEQYKALLYVSAQEQQEKQEHLANEYDDDYDDQYDEIDVKLGGADNGFYDFDQIKLFNKVAREDEAEGSFWEANRNTNRAPTNGNGNGNKNENSDSPKQFRGPDKIKGGRIVGPDGKIVRKPNPKKNKNRNQGGAQQARQQQGAQTKKNNSSNEAKKQQSDQQQQQEQQKT
eukprot:scaffold24768_cov215-Cylindrotheca_fusiformis.AAC.1